MADCMAGRGRWTAAGSRSVTGLMDTERETISYGVGRQWKIVTRSILNIQKPWPRLSPCLLRDARLLNQRDANAVALIDNPDRAQPEFLSRMY